MFDLNAFKVKQLGDQDFQAIDGTIHNSQSEAQQQNFTVAAATISNSLERIAVVQEKMQKQGEEAGKKADSTLAAAMNAMQGILPGGKF
jgi:DNA-binding ferritin-like protein